jgi:hypothetical protein
MKCVGLVKLVGRGKFVSLELARDANRYILKALRMRVQMKALQQRTRISKISNVVTSNESKAGVHGKLAVLMPSTPD